MITIVEEPPDAGASIEALLDEGFGRDRHQKTSYRFRDGVAPLGSLRFAALSDGVLVGTIRAWPIRVGRIGRAVLVGPVAVARTHRKHGIGARLVETLLVAARAEGWPLAVLVGNTAYYGRFGFTGAAGFGITMPNETAARVLALPLAKDAIVPEGIISPWRDLRRSAA
jgi:predicted N-acetyltransferase YhbS